MRGQLVLKLSYWEELPYKLCALAHPNVNVSTIAARRCLELWKQQGPGARHRQSRRFLDPDYGSREDPPLRTFVLRMADGESPEDMKEEERAPLLRWLVAFRSVPWSISSCLSVTHCESASLRVP